MKYSSTLFSLGVAICSFLTAINSVCAQTTAFTYNGRFVDGTNAVNGSYDFTFSLWDAVTNGTQQGNLLTNTDVVVSDGFFMATLDFGNQFPGADRWLEISERTNGGVTFTQLIPRQSMLPTPYAIYSAHAGNANTATTAGTAGSANSVSATNIVGTMQLTQLPGAILTNNQSGVTLGGTFSGNGGGLTNLNASKITSGVIPLAQLPIVVITNAAANLTIGATNVIAPLTVPPTVPTFPIGSVGTSGSPQFVAVAGRYVYVLNVGANTLQIFDVSIPSTPVSVGFASTGLVPNSIAVAGRYAYVVNDTSNTLQIFDVGNPSSPISIGLVSTGKNPFSLTVAGHYAYVVNFTGNTLQIFDVSTPSSPVLVGSAGTGKGPVSIAVAGGYAYVANNLANTLQIFDVHMPTTPISVGSFDTGVNSEPQSVAVVGSYAYLVNFIGAKLQVFNINDPTNPKSVGSIGTVSQPVSIALAGRYAFVTSSGPRKFQIFDVSKPSSPTYVGSFDAGGNPSSVAVAGRYAYVAIYGSETLQVFDLGGAYIQQFEAGTIETGTLQTRDTATIGNNLDVRGGLTVSSSARISGGLSVDNGTIRATNFVGNFTGSGSALINLNASQISGGTVPLAALPSGVLTNGAGGVILTGTFTGNGANLTSLNANNLSTGTVPLARLADITSNQLNVTTWQLATNLNGGNAALATNVVSGISITNAFITNSIFAGDGGGLTNLNASQISGGTLPLAALPSDALTNGASGVTLSGTFNGNGSSLTNTTTAGNYVFAYATRMQPLVSVGVFQDITFGFNGQINGWIHTRGSGSFTNTQTGLYLVQFTAELSAKNQNEATISVRGALNGTEIRGSQSSVLVMKDSLTALAKSFLVSVNSGDVLSLQFTSTRGGVIAQNTGDGMTRPSASCTIIRIQ